MDLNIGFWSVQRMDKFKRFLTSQRLGRVVAEVTLEGNCRGFVKLTAQDEARVLLFSFRQDDIALLSSSQEDWCGLLVRLSVFQAHKRMSRDGHFPVGLQVLSFASPLWLGDLMLAPYGGATFGVERRQKRCNLGGGWQK